MVIRINPSQQSVWRNNDELQIGLGSDRLVLKKLTRGQERLVALLYKGVADDLLAPIARDLAAEDVEGLLKQLEPMLLPRKAKPDRLSEEYISTAFAELAKATMLHNIDGAQVLTQRMSRMVNVNCIDKTGLLMIKALSAAGIGRVSSEDSEKVSLVDCGNLGFENSDIGKQRTHAAAEFLERGLGPTALIDSSSFTDSQFDAVDVAVLIAQQAITPRSYARWLNRDVPHVAIVFEADSVWVSPLIVPGKNACLFCLDIDKTNRDSAWPTIATQLLQSKQKFDDATSSLFAVSLALQKITSQLDQLAGFETTNNETVGYRLDSKTAEVREVTWAKQSDCGCRFER